MEKKNFPSEPTLKLPISPMGSNLHFNIPLPITNHNHTLLDNIWASKNNPKSFIPVLHTLSAYFHNKNKFPSSFPKLKFYKPKYSCLIKNYFLNPEATYSGIFHRARLENQISRDRSEYFKRKGRKIRKIISRENEEKWGVKKIYPKNRKRKGKNFEIFPKQIGEIF